MEPVDALHHLGGVATYRQLVQLCGRDSLDVAVLSGDVLRLARGRYALPSVDGARRAAIALTGVVSHASAALHWGWSVKTVPDPPHITVGRTRKLTPAQRRLAIVHHARLSADEVVGGATSTERTLADCLKGLANDEALAIADSALREKSVTPARLRQIAARLRGPGSGRARRVAAEASGLAANPFESVIRAISLEVPELRLEPQATLTGERFFAQPDLVDRRLRIVVEADSNTWHNSSRVQLRRDCRRYTGLVVRDWIVLRFCWEDAMFESAYVRDCLGAAVAVAQRRAQRGQVA
jgi:hypothetical protein